MKFQLLKLNCEPDDGDIVNNFLIQMKWSRKNGSQRACQIFNKMLRLRANGDNIQLTNKFIFKYLKSGEGAKYLFSQVDGDFACKWERFSKKRLSLLYTLAHYKVVAFFFNFFRSQSDYFEILAARPRQVS